jgi:glucose/arabinose dehydrogenase
MRKSIVASLMITTTVIAAALWAAASAGAQNQTAPVLTGTAAYGDWRNDTPGVRRHITASDLPAPYASRSASNTSSVVDPPRGAALKVPPEFTVTVFASGFDTPRLLRIAPNGDIFLAETGAGQVRVMRAADGAPKPQRNEIFAGDLDSPFGIAFYPPGPDPQFVYVASTERVVRFPYRNGDLKARGAAETIIPSLPSGGHFTRDIAFSPDGKQLYVSVGSASNVAQSMSVKRGTLLQSWEAAHGLGASWDSEARRADVLVFDPDGKNERSFANGIRNCVGLAVQPGNGPGSGTVWCSTNERDGLGDNLPPDYVTRVKEGGFYGWPWYYIGSNEDPRHPGERPDLKGKTIVPDVLLQPHSAPLQLAFYDAPATAPGLFPPEYRGDVFVASHGSWNRAKRTGYKIIRIHLQNGVPTGEYQDFVTGFVLDDERVWGRPVGVAAAHDGALLFSEDGNGTIWRVARANAE